MLSVHQMALDTVNLTRCINVFIQEDNNLGHLFTYKTGPQIFYQKCFKHDIICIIDDNNLIHNFNNYNNLHFCPRRLAVNKMATRLWCYFTLRMRDYP